MVTSIPLSNTRAAASGSAQMLNSAAGVTLPSAIAPPIRTIRSSSGRRLGVARQKSATFVSGPTGISVTGSSEARIRSARKSTACSATGPRDGSGSSGPSSPLSPWT